jgi:hypothetical protein
MESRPSVPEGFNFLQPLLTLFPKVFSSFFDWNKIRKVEPGKFWRTIHDRSGLGLELSRSSSPHFFQMSLALPSLIVKPIRDLGR